MFFKFLIYYNAKPYFHIAPQARISAKIIFIVLNPFLKCWFTFLQAPFYLTSIHISDFMKKIPAHQSQRKCSCIHTDNKTCIFFFFTPFFSSSEIVQNVQLLRNKSSSLAGLNLRQVLKKPCKWMEANLMVRRRNYSFKSH